MHCHITQKPDVPDAACRLKKTQVGQKSYKSLRIASRSLAQLWPRTRATALLECAAAVCSQSMHSTLGGCWSKNTSRSVSRAKDLA